MANRNDTESAQSFPTDSQNPARTIEDIQRMIALLQFTDFTECVSEYALIGEHMILGEISKALTDLERLCIIEPRATGTRVRSVKSHP